MSTQFNAKPQTKRKTPLVVTLLIVGLISLLLGWAASHWTNSSEPPVLEQETWKTFLKAEWRSPDGQVLDTSQWANKTVVLNFWGSWCPPCVEEIPMLSKLSSSLNDKNVLFLGIGIDSPSNIREFLKKSPISYPVAMGGIDGSNWSKRFGNDTGALPFTVIINPEGKIILTKLGKISENEIKKSILKNFN